MTESIITSSPVGALKLTADDQNLLQLEFLGLNEKGSVAKTKHPILKQAIEELAEYFSGKRTAFTVPLRLEGTDFQKKVWQQLKKIPHGRVLSYGQVGEKLGGKRYARAVGTANGRNPIAIIVPCHRVIETGGGLGGFACDLKIKEKLLALESRE